MSTTIMAKDRLGELLQKRGESADNDVVIDAENIGNGNGNSSNKTDLKKTFERAEVLGQWILNIEQNVEVIRQLLNKLDDLTISHKDLVEKIENYFQNNTSICHKINGKLKEIEAEMKTVGSDSAEGRIKNIQYGTLKTRYVEIFKKNNLELERFKSIQKDRLEAQLRAKGVRVTDEELVALLEQKTDIQLFTDNILAETAEAKRVLGDIEERHQQLLKIERMLVEVRDLFLQMAILIDAQQDLVDRVEYQAQVARDYVGQAPKILSDAKKKKAKYLKCKIIGISTIVVLIIIILILLLK